MYYACMTITQKKVLRETGLSPPTLLGKLVYKKDPPAVFLPTQSPGAET